MSTYSTLCVFWPSLVRISLFIFMHCTCAKGFQLFTVFLGFFFLLCVAFVTFINGLESTCAAQHPKHTRTAVATICNCSAFINAGWLVGWLDGSFVRCPCCCFAAFPLFCFLFSVFQYFPMFTHAQGTFCWSSTNHQAFALYCLSATEIWYSGMEYMGSWSSFPFDAVLVSYLIYPSV